MATVKITGRLFDRVLSNARAKVNPLVEAAEKSYPEDLVQRIHDKAMAPYIPLLTQLPKEFVNKTTQIAMPLDITFTHPQLGIKRLTGDIVNQGSFYVFSGYPRGCMLSRHYRGFQLVTTHPDAAEFLPELTEYAIRATDARQKAEGFVSGVSVILRRHATLSPALKEWPALWDLIPEDAKEQHRKVVTRSKSAKPAKSASDEDRPDAPNLDALTSVVVAAKMRGDA